MAKITTSLANTTEVVHNNTQGLNDGDYIHLTQLEKDKFDGIETGAEVNVNADWNSISGDSQILNKPLTFEPSPHTHPISEIINLQTSLDNKVDENLPIIGSTKTKITFDSKGLVTNGVDATTADINDSINRRYVTDSDIIDINNLSGVNSGDQTSIVGISGTKTQFNTALTDGDFVYTSDIVEIAQDAVGTILVDTSTIDITYDDITPTISAIVKPNSITSTELSNTINISEFINDSSYETTTQLNTRDTNNRARVNHTGTQLASTISDFTTASRLAVVDNSITDGILDKAPSQNAVFDALQIKENVANKVTDISTGVNNTTYPTSLAVKSYADNLVVGMLNDRGTWDASVNLFPTTGGSGTDGAIRKGDMWYVSVAGTLGGKAVTNGDSFRALVNTPGQTASGWSVLEANIGYVPENQSNKSSSYTLTSTETYPDTKALVDGLVTKENTFSKNTAFNKNFGTTAGTVVEGGTLGSNAYTSIAYLPLTGGTLSGQLQVNANIIGNTGRLDRIHMKSSEGNADLSAAIAISKNITMSTAHIIEDNSTITPPSNSSEGYGMVDMSTVISGGFMTNHIHAFQSRLRYTSSANMATTNFSSITSFYSENQILGTGIVDKVIGFKAADTYMPNAGKITKQYGLLIENLTTGLTNYGMWVDTRGNYVKALSIGSTAIDATNALNVTGTSLFSSSVTATSFISGRYNYDTNGITIRNSANNAGLWSINKGAGDGSENWNFYNFERNLIDFSLKNDTGAATFSNSVTASSFIKSGATSTNLLLAGGGDIAQSTFQTALTNPITGSLTSGYIPKATGSTILGDSLIFDNGTNVGIGTTNPVNTLQVGNSDVDGGSNSIGIVGGATQGTNELQFKLKGVGLPMSVVGSYASGHGITAGGILYFKTNSDANALTERMRITNTGNVLIGTTTDDGVNKLQVSGSLTATSFNGSATLTGTPTAPTAAAGTNTTQIATTAFVLANSSARPYKVYTALLSQSGTNAPTATVLENTLGGTVVWTRTSNGIYVGTLAGVFTANKTFTTNTFGTFSGFAQFASVSVNTVNINTTNSSGTLTDGLLNGNSIEIRVYN